MKNKPLVSVLMTAYNADRYIAEAIQSILEQTYYHLELIIVDDGSHDRTLEIVNQFKQKDKRIRVIALKENQGPSTASNVGIRQMRGKYLARMDADDVAYLDRIEKQVKFLEKNTRTVVVGGQCKLISAEGESIGEKKFPTDHTEIYKSLFKINPIQHPSCMINTQLLPADFIYYDNDSVLAHDLELIFKLTEFGKLANLNDFMLYYRQYNNSLSLRNPKQTFLATMQVRERSIKKYNYHPDVFSRLISGIQVLVVSVIPSQAVYPMFVLFRMRSSFKQFNIFFRLIRNAQSKIYSRIVRLRAELSLAFVRE